MRRSPVFAFTPVFAFVGDEPRKLPDRETDRDAELCSSETGKGGDVLCALLLLLLPLRIPICVCVCDCPCGEDDPDGTGDGDWL